MLNSYRRFKPERLLLRSYKETWEKSQRKNSLEFARRRRGNRELAEKRGSPRAMCSRGRKPKAKGTTRTGASVKGNNGGASSLCVGPAEERSRWRARGRRGSGGKKE
jgi:hypothetical protein